MISAISGSTENATSASRQSIQTSTAMMPTSVNTSPNTDTTPTVNSSFEHVDVGRDAGHQPADRIAIVEAQIEPLQMREHLPSAGRT